MSLPNAESDIINRPEHYHKGGIDVIGFMTRKLSPDMMTGFYLVNAIKYLVRFRDKGTPLDDLHKAQFYVNKLIEQYSETPKAGEPNV